MRFEPTPQRRTGTDLPAYSTVPVTSQDPSDTTSGPTTDATTRDPTFDESQATETVAPDDQKAGGDQAADEGVDWIGVLLRVGAVVLVLALIGGIALVPRSLRRRARRRRLAGPPEDIWEELRATAVDLALPWPTGRSPQEVGRVLVDHLGDRSDTARPERPRTGPDADPQATAALERLVAAIEVARYARPGSIAPAPGLAADVQSCCDSLEAGATRGVALRARWLPRSAWQRQSSERAEHDHLVGA